MYVICTTHDLTLFWSERLLLFLPSPHNPTLKVGIYRSSSIGDVVLATACLDLLAQLKLPVEVTWVCRSPAIGLMQALFPSINFVDCGEHQEISKTSLLVTELSSVHLFIDLQTSIRSRLLGRFLKKNFSIPIFTTNKSQVYRMKLIAEAKIFGRKRPLRKKNLKPTMQQYLSMSETLKEAILTQLPPEYTDVLLNYKPHPFLSLDHIEATEPWVKELQYGKWIAVAPGASYETKRAPLSVLSDILQKTEMKYREEGAGDLSDIGLLIVGNQNDRQFGVDLLGELNWQGVSLNLAGKVSLNETAQALSYASVLLTNDSGLGHIAEAVGVNVGVLFGPTIEGFGFTPHLKGSYAFSSLLGCRPCSKHGKSSCSYGDKKCFTDIDSEAVATYLHSRLVLPSINNDQVLRKSRQRDRA